MVVKNLKCETCRNNVMCSGFKALKKFSEDYARTPLVPDITVNSCGLYVNEMDADENESEE